MSDITTCRGCGVILDCQEIEDPNLYTLDNAGLPFVTNCPPGFSCNQSDQTTLHCCDKFITVDYPKNSTEIQRTALLDAAIQQCRVIEAFCSGGPPDDRKQLYFNTTQNCTSLCPDGSPFTYTVPPGIVLAFSQSDADRIAGEIACRNAKALKICLQSLDKPECCKGSAYFGKISANQGGLTWLLASGSLPTGLSLSAGPSSIGVISGTPTVAGSYTFTIQAFKGGTGSMNKTFTICVIEIGPASLSTPMLGTPYSDMLTATGCAATPLSWQVTAGALPDGLTLDEETGVISGTPTLQGTFNFTITLQTQAT